MATALLLKREGNDAFARGEYKEAETLYTRAISKEPSNALLYTNRAFARIKLSSWEACVDDCLAALDLQGDSMKAYHRLAQAQLALRHPNEALSSALRAYELCMDDGKDPAAGRSNAAAVSTLVLEAKRQKWEARERERLRRRSPLLAEIEAGFERERARALQEVRDMYGAHPDSNSNEAAAAAGPEGMMEEEMAEIEAEFRKKVEEVRSVFALADPANSKRREVPDYMIDSISFAVMHDPVITRRGQSYERSTIEQHLRVTPTDPLTREPLTIDDLRPNLALKAACEEFLAENGWAVDW